MEKSDISRGAQRGGIATGTSTTVKVEPQQRQQMLKTLSQTVQTAQSIWGNDWRFHLYNLVHTPNPQDYFGDSAA